MSLTAMKDWNRYAGTTPNVTSSNKFDSAEPKELEAFASSIMSMLEAFYERLQEERKTCKINSLTLSKLKYDLLIDKVRVVRAKVRKEGNDYRFLKRYGVIEIDGKEKLISPVSDSGDIRYFVSDDELFDILHDAHISTGHGGRDRMKNHLRTKFTNITYKDIMLYLALCEKCLEKQKHPKRGFVVRPILLKELRSMCRLELIDYRSRPDGDYNYVMVYEDDLTKFVVLKPLKTKTTDEMCESVIDVFSLLGAPSVLQSESRELVETTVQRLRTVWPEFKIIHGKSKQGAESPHRDIESMMAVWMQRNRTSHWAKGLKYVQLMRNSGVHKALRRTPYEALFGCRPKRGLASYNLPADIFDNVESEEDLEKMIGEMQAKPEGTARMGGCGEEDREENCFVGCVGGSTAEGEERSEEALVSPAAHKSKRLRTYKMAADGKI